MNFSLRTLVLLSVWAFLAIWIYKAISEVLKEETTFNEYESDDVFELPVISICPTIWYTSALTPNSFDEVIKQIELEKINYVIQITKQNSEVVFLTLTDLKSLRENNITFSFSYYIPSATKKPTVCVSIDLSKLDFSPFMYLQVYIGHNNDTDVLMVENTATSQYDFTRNMGKLVRDS